MTDRISRDQRSENMARIHSRDTVPELRLRSALFKLGLRFRLYRKDIPGTPDIVFVRQKLAIQVRGCFWHQHPGCPRGRMPLSNITYWKQKLRRNVERDQKNDAAIEAAGWRLIVVWECELKKDTDVEKAALHIHNTLNNFLAS